jgi:acetyltransferase-like isoleucine patch superfamily enzyme
MNIIKTVMKFVRYVFARIRHACIMRRYNRFNIAEYYRRLGMKIGEKCSIIPVDLGATEPYLVSIGNHVTIAQNVVLMTHDGGAWIFRNEDPNIQVFGPIIIEDNCVIGANVIILPNVCIGRNSIVAAGSVVISDVPSDSIVMGVPARVFGSIEKYREKCFERWQAQRPEDCIIEDGKCWWDSINYTQNREKLKKHLLKLFFGGSE